MQARTLPTGDIPLSLPTHEKAGVTTHPRGLSVQKVSGHSNKGLTPATGRRRRGGPHFDPNTYSMLPLGVWGSHMRLHLHRILCTLRDPTRLRKLFLTSFVLRDVPGSF